MYNFTERNDVYLYCSNSGIKHDVKGVIFDDNGVVLDYSSYFSVPIPNKKICEIYSKQTIPKLEIDEYIDESCICITKWFESFGHIMDSMYNLADFYYLNKYDKKNFKVLLWIFENDKNMIDLAEIIFGSNFMVVNQNKSIIKLKHVVLIHNYPFKTECFLSFPKSICEKVKINLNDDEEKSHKNIFITRRNHFNKNDNRRLINQEELEIFFEKNGFFILNPENYPNKYLYNKLKNTQNIIITNGSALATLVFINNVDKTKIFCLNSQSYLPIWRKNIEEGEIIPELYKKEDFEKDIWKNFIERFNFTYIDSYKNIITENQKKYILDNLIM